MSSCSRELFSRRWEEDLRQRAAKGMLRGLTVHSGEKGILNLADNDYLGLARDPALARAAAAAAKRHGTSASASPLLTGYREPHRELEEALCQWHGFPCGLLWNTGFAANQAVLSRLSRPGDLVLADRLIHRSMIEGIMRGGARLVRFRHNDLSHLESLLIQHAGKGRPIFVVTESVFSMDGDSPDLAAMAGLRDRHGFFWILDEAHAVGWYGPGLAVLKGVEGEVDLLVGTLGKGLGVHGAYTLFHDRRLREFLINFAGEFIYSTYLSPMVAAAALAGVARARELWPENGAWRSASRDLRHSLAQSGFSVPPGDSPVIPLFTGTAAATLAAGHFLRQRGILTAPVRPPTVPEGTGRLRISWKRGHGPAEMKRLLQGLANWRAGIQVTP